MEGQTRVQFTNHGVGRRVIVCTLPADLCDTEQRLAVALTRKHLLRGGVVSWPTTGSHGLFSLLWVYQHGIVVCSG